MWEKVGIICFPSLLFNTTSSKTQFNLFFSPLMSGRRAHGTDVLDCIQIKVIPQELQRNISTHESFTCLLKIQKEPSSLYEPTQYFTTRAKAIKPSVLTCQSPRCTGTAEGGHGIFGIWTEQEQLCFATCSMLGSSTD